MPIAMSDWTRRAAAISAAALLCAVPAGGQDPASTSEAPPEDRRALALSLTNEARGAEGLDPLSLNPRLVDAARNHARDMLARDYYAHVSPEGDTVRDRFLAEGGGTWRRVAENIAVCRGCPTPPGPDRVRAFHEGWMQSPEHRENILDPGLEEFGFAMAFGGDTTYAVQTFAGPGRPDGLPPGEPEERASPDRLTAAALAAVNDARRAEGLEALERNGALAAAAARLTNSGAVRDAEGALGEALAAEAGDWRSVGLLSGECGGCGTVPTTADARHFVRSWLDDPQLSDTLLDPSARTFGFALTASGAGRKGAVALTGRSASGNGG